MTNTRSRAALLAWHRQARADELYCKANNDKKGAEAAREQQQWAEGRLEQLPEGAVG